VLKSEKALLNLSRTDMDVLKADQKDISAELKFKFLAGEKPDSALVQKQIVRHYNNIRAFWGVTSSAQLSAAAYKGLADLYVNDERYTAINSKPDPEFALFMSLAMRCFADTVLQ